MYGKDNLKLTETGLTIDNKEQNMPVYVINDKPKNAADFNFKSVPIKIKTQDGRAVKCWIGNYNGATVLFADGANYETIVRDFGKTRQFETIFGKRTALKANIDVIEIDMNNPDSGLNYSRSGNVIVGANMVKTENIIDLQKEVSLLKNRAIEAVTINQNVAIYIDDDSEGLSTSQNFVDTINAYVKSNDLGANIKLLFTDEYIKKVLNLLKLEYGEENVQEKFREIVKQLQKENKEISIIFEEEKESKTNEYKQLYKLIFGYEPKEDEVIEDYKNLYKELGIFSYIESKGNYSYEYVDTVSSTRTKANFITNLNQIRADGILSIIKVSDFKKQISKTSGIFTFLNSSLNLKEMLQKRSIEFIKQTANNFDFNQIPNIDIGIIADILTKSENKYDGLKKYLDTDNSDSISMYYLGLSNDEQRNVFIEEILKRALVVNYLRNLEQDNAYYGLKDKNLENVLAKALFEKYKLQQNFEIKSNEKLNENLSASEVEFELLQKISQLSEKAFNMEVKDKQDMEEKTKAIDDIINLIPLYAERNIDFKTATNIDVMEIKNIKGILSAA